MEKTIIGVYILNQNRFKHYAGPFTNDEFEQWKVWMQGILNPTWTMEFEFIQIDRNVTDAFFAQEEARELGFENEADRIDCDILDFEAEERRRS